MNVLILGGSGYLGSKVIQRLADQNVHHLVCTKRENSIMNRVQPLIDSGLVKVIPASVDAIDAAMQYMSFDIVVNTACSYGRKSMLYNNVIEANIDFPLKVLNKAVEMGTRRFLTVGTGLPDDLNMYSFSKKMFSEFGKYYAQAHEIDFLNLKLEMFYGADEPRNRFIPSLIEKMILGEIVDVTLGTQHRDIIAISDIIDAVFLVLNSDLHGYHEISVGTGIAPTISDLVDFIWKQTGKKSIVNKGAIPMRANEPDCVGDPKQLQCLGEWHPVNWHEGISAMIRKMVEEIER